MSARFLKGDRVFMTRAVAKQMPQGWQRNGVVSSDERSSEFVNVRRDGFKRAERFHVHFVVRVHTRQGRSRQP